MVKVVRTALPEVVVLEWPVYRDERGWFAETYSQNALRDALAGAGLEAPEQFVQDNHSCSAAGVLRGLHYQRDPYAQGKLVRVVRGSAWDVAVDIRPKSPTFGRWACAEISASNRRQVWIPEGFAHGFLALEDGTELVYKTTAPYARGEEGAFRWDDPKLAIQWPLDLVGGRPILSEKDAAAPAWEAA